MSFPFTVRELVMLGVTVPGFPLPAALLADRCDYDSQFANRIDDPTFGPTRRGSDVESQQYTLGYTFVRPDMPLLDFGAKLYSVHTNPAQKRLDSNSPAGELRATVMSRVCQGGASPTRVICHDTCSRR